MTLYLYILIYLLIAYLKNNKYERVVFPLSILPVALFSIQFKKPKKFYLTSQAFIKHLFYSRPWARYTWSIKNDDDDDDSDC